MEKQRFSFDLFLRCLQAVLTVAALTAWMLLIGRDTLGDAVVALLFLVPIGFSTTRWGQIPGICASVVAALAFDFFFIPPYDTLNIGSLEGWSVLVIFLVVSVLIVGRIQYGLSQAQEQEREAIFMFELISALANLHTRDAIARVLAAKIQENYQAALVQVDVDVEGSTHLFSAPPETARQGKPDRVIPLHVEEGLAGSISIWRGKFPLPPESNRLFQSFIIQGELAFERARLDENRAKV
jgi:two-component system sensor histidine kinase KdpD